MKLKYKSFFSFFKNKKKLKKKLKIFFYGPS